VDAFPRTDVDTALACNALGLVDVDELLRRVWLTQREFCAELVCQSFHSIRFW
jgi:hypothetical protein